MPSWRAIAPTPWTAARNERLYLTIRTLVGAAGAVVTLLVSLYAPISYAFPCGRAFPSKSVATTATVTPASFAGLEDSR